MYGNDQNQNNNQYNNFNEMQQPVNPNDFVINQTQMQNNQIYPDMNLNMQQPNNIQNQNGMDSNSQLQNYNNFNENSGQEQPPVLEPIKPLSSVQAVDVPNMDALGPMNIMPEVLPQTNTSFENSSEINSGVYNTLQPNVNQDAVLNHNINGENYINLQPVDNSMLYNVPQPEATSPISQTGDMSNSVELNSFDANPQQDTQTLISPDLTEEQEELSSLPESDLKDGISLGSSNETENTNIPVNNVEISDLRLGDEKQKSEQPIQEDILDFETPSSSESEMMDLETKNDASSSEDSGITITVDKIKKLVDEIKSSGIDVSMEEFDFEEMYQLIIKINK